MDIGEGLAKITANGGVFYNPKMAKLRDISVMFLRAEGARGKSLLDCTAATGIRGIRYALEAGVKQPVLLDINQDAYKAASANVKKNRIKGEVLNVGIQEFANTTDKKFDIIDLDPFGSPVPYIYDLMKVGSGDTLFMVTATDTAVLCGAHPAACVKLYGAKPLHSELCQEGGTRILLGFILKNAMQFNSGIEPLLSIADMHYIRVFLRLKKGAEAAADSSKELGFGAFCVSCGRFDCERGIAPRVSNKCGTCGATMELFGPLWLGRLSDKGILAKMLSDKKEFSEESRRLVSKIHEELDTPFFYSVPKVTKRLGIGSVSPALVAGELKARKHAVSFTHFGQDSIKTDATLADVLKAVRKVSKTK